MLNKLSLYCLAFLCCPLLMLAQNKQPTFTVETDTKETTVNSYVEVDFILENGRGTNFKAPKIKNAKIVSGPSTSSSTTIINGKISQKMSYNYMLQSLKPGFILISSASIEVNGKVLKTDRIRVRILRDKPKTITSQNGTNPVPLDGEYFVRAEPSTASAKIGQQILLDYKLYTAVNIESYNIEEEGEYQGFYAKDIQRYNSKAKRETVNGKQYTTKVLKRVALFPQQAGKLTIRPMRIQLGVSGGNPKQRKSFFFNRNIRRVPYTTEAVDISVSPFSTDAPASFSGAVGIYEAGVEVNRTSLTTDNDLSIRLTISGDGDVKRIQAPDIGLPVDSFELYDPRIVDESSFEKQGQLQGQKIIEYLAVPRYPGKYTIQPTFTYFNTDTLDYVTLKGNKYYISVQQGSKKVRDVVTTEPTVVEDIRHIKATTSLNEQGSTFFGSSLFWIMSVLPLIFLGGVIVVHREQVRRNSIDGAVLKSKGARKMAEKRLKTAEKHLKSNDSSAFYDEISAASLGYICDKLRISRAELSKDNVREKMKTLAVGKERIEQFMAVLKTCEMARFAGMYNPSAMKETYENAAAAIVEIEEKTKEA